MNDEPIVIGPEELRRLRESAEQYQSELCLMEHPGFRVLCIKKIGHTGQHWFMCRWVDAKDAIEQTRSAISSAIAGEL